MTIRRLKTYAGSQGYVYQYYFVGQRPSASGDAEDYVFDASSDRKTTFPVTVSLPKSVVSGWNQKHGRALTSAEQYAAVKMRLFRAFDETDLTRPEWSLRLEAGFLEESLQSLGVE